MAADAQEVVKLLDDALAVMNDEGKHWHQGDYSTDVPHDDGKYAYCSLGALRHVRYGSAFGWEPNDSVLDHAEYALSSVIPMDDLKGTQTRIVTWNDEEERTWDDVVAAFTAAKEKALAGEVS